MTNPIFSDLRFDALRNALYHTERGAFLALLSRLLNFFVIVFGATVAANAAKLFHVEENWLELCVVIFAALQLVFDFGGRARMHEFLQRRYYELLAEMENEDLQKPSVLKKWRGKLLVISGEEPMIMRALDAVAYNKALSATSDDANVIANRLYVSWWHRRMRHVFAFQSASFPLEQSRISWRNRIKHHFRRNET